VGVSDAVIPPRVQRFISTHIDSIEKLEVLLLMRARAEREWTARDVSQELRITESSAVARLEDLTARRLLVSRGNPPAYRFSPASSEDAQAVSELQDTYSTRRVSVISFIFSKPLDKVRGFADAFRLKRDKDEGNG
jgi:predicted ArsR family transcriptional regulator